MKRVGTCKIHEWNCEIWLGRYWNGDPAIQIYDSADHEPVMTASVCIHPERLDKGEIAIKNWTENEGIQPILHEAGIISEFPVRLVHLTGSYIEIPVHTLLVDLPPAVEEFPIKELAP